MSACTDVAGFPALLPDGYLEAPLTCAHHLPAAAVHGHNEAPCLRAIPARSLSHVLLPEPCSRWSAWHRYMLCLTLVPW